MDLYQKYLESAINFLSFRARSEKEVRDYLTKKLASGQSSSGRKKAPDDVIEKIISFLKKRKFLNDVDFTKWFVESRARFKQKSMRVVQLELRQKGITKEIIDEVFGQETNVSDLELAKKLVEKKIDRYKGLTKQELYQKLGGFLARKGYDWDVIKASIDEVLQKGV